MAPEHARGAEVDGRADVYALACVLYRTLTGAVPYDRPSDLDKLWAHLNDPAPSLLAVCPDLPRGLDDVIRRAMAKDRDDRFATAGELARAAEHALLGTRSAARETTTGPRVVVAEDSVLLRAGVVSLLEEAGFDVVGQAGDGEEAIRLAIEHRPDLVILDVKMPKLDGLSAAEKIAGDRIAPVLMLTAFSQRELVERARDAGAMAYLVKPFSKADLLPAIEIAASRYVELAELEREVADLAERLETRKLVDRAKSVLQTNFWLSEPDSFRWIQKTAMDKRVSMRQVAELVVDEAGSSE
jgi:response regulator NasT